MSRGEPELVREADREALGEGESVSEAESEGEASGEREAEGDPEWETQAEPLGLPRLVRDTCGDAESEALDWFRETDGLELCDEDRVTLADAVADTETLAVGLGRAEGEVSAVRVSVLLTLALCVVEGEPVDERDSLELLVALDEKLSVVESVSMVETDELTLGERDTRALREITGSLVKVTSPTVGVVDSVGSGVTDSEPLEELVDDAEAETERVIRADDESVVDRFGEAEMVTLAVAHLEPRAEAEAEGDRLSRAPVLVIAAEYETYSLVPVGERDGEPVVLPLLDGEREPRALAEGDWLTDGEGEIVGDCVSEGVKRGDTETRGDDDGDVVILGLRVVEGEGDVVFVAEIEGEGLADGDIELDALGETED